VLINPRSKEINLHNKRFQHSTRSVMMNCSSGISTIVYKLANEATYEVKRKVALLYEC
jgi:hypothetical protein